MYRTDPYDDPVIDDVPSLLRALEPVRRRVGDAMIVHLDDRGRFTCLASSPSGNLLDLLDDEPFLLASAQGCRARAGYLVIVSPTTRGPRPAEVAAFDQLAAAHAEIGVMLRALVVTGPGPTLP